MQARSWRATVLRLIGAITDVATVARVGRKARRGTLGELDLIAFRGYGTSEWLRLQARVIEATGLTPGKVNDRWWRNVVSAYHRFVSLEVPGATVQATIDQTTVEQVTDLEGYVEFEIPNRRPEASGWRAVALELLGPAGPDGRPITATAQVLVPHPDAEIGIISDIDDTVLRTGITEKVVMVRNTLLHNATTRAPFPGVSEFYRALRDGDGTAPRPIFYVSGSPWNLYDMIERFLGIQDIPPGPLFLRHWGIDEHKFIHEDGREYKLDRIRRLLAVYPGLRFVLIGDSGEEDPEIYAEIIRTAPARIAAVYIRDVTADGRRDRAVQTLLGALHEHDIAAAFGAATIVAATDAADRGLIAPTRLDEVRAATARDRAE